MQPIEIKTAETQRTNNISIKNINSFQLKPLNKKVELLFRFSRGI